MTITSRVAIARLIGSIRDSAVAPASVRTSIISSVAYATEESGSELKTGKARNFGRSWCSCLCVARARPTSSRLNRPREGFVRFEIDDTVPDDRTWLGAEPYD